MKRFKGFTLIELLIVVAIIGILAAIAVPNFLNAQVRAKVSRAVSDMKTLETAIEMYQLDNNNYPPAAQPRVPGSVDAWHPNEVRYYRMTTPIAYISSVPKDPFTNFSAEDFARWGSAYDFVNETWGHAWRFNSWGPDTINHWGGIRAPYGGNLSSGCPGGNNPLFLYQSSNGLHSLGDIVWVGRKVSNDNFCDIQNGI